MTEAKHSPLQITRSKLMQLPKKDLVTELLAATSLHAELVAALFNLVEAVESAVDLDNHMRSFGTRVAAAHNVLQKAREK